MLELITDNFFWVLFLAGFNLLLAISGYIADKLSQRKNPADGGTSGEAGNKNIPHQ